MKTIWQNPASPAGFSFGPRALHFELYFLLFPTILLCCLACPLDAQSKLYGMASHCGPADNGSIFKIRPDGSDFSVVYGFPVAYPGISPQYTHLTQAANGKLYGMTSRGGSNNAGVLFEYDPAANTYGEKYDFDKTGGDFPFGSLVRATSGKLYGMTSEGGSKNAGVLFEYDPETNVYAKKFDFDTINGAFPNGSLIQIANGKLYGMTTGGGVYAGVLFEYDPATNVLAKKLDFDGSNGAAPYGSLTYAANGKLYGMTAWGGDNAGGVLFEYDPGTGTYAKKLDFNDTGGAHPYGSLAEAANGKLYGMTSGGGSEGVGVLFEYDPGSNTYLVKIQFEINGSLGGNPYGSLVQASDGELYGMSSDFGGGEGVLFQYHPGASAGANKFTFNDAVFLNESNVNGLGPRGSLMQASDGKLYGMTSEGGNKNSGVLFAYDPVTDVYAKKIDFNGNNGDFPTGGLLRAANGKLYGVTVEGGSRDYGVLFEYDPAANAYIDKFDFDGMNGSRPRGNLIQASNGKIYGTTQGHDLYTPGSVLFEYDPGTGVYAKKHDFDYFNDPAGGASPHGSLMQASNGNIYGTTYLGGNNGYGVLFEYVPGTNAYTKKFDFDDLNGRNPEGYLVQAPNGKLYGVTGEGGSSDDGVLFEYDPATGVYAKKHDFGSPGGYAPNGSLKLASNGKLYGTAYGGSKELGILFEYDPETNMYAVKSEFDDTSGIYYPVGSLMQASDGKMYGIAGATIPATNDHGGILFTCDTSGKSCTKLRELSVSDGCFDSYWFKGNLIEVSATNGATFPESSPDFGIFPNPACDAVSIRPRGFEGKTAALTLYDSVGRIVWQQEVGLSETSEFQIDISGHPAGVYWINLRSESRELTRRLVLCK